MAYEELFADLLRAEREEKTNPRYTFVVKGYFSGAVPDWGEKLVNVPSVPRFAYDRRSCRDSWNMSEYLITH
jgi:hypothetical protein